MRRLLGHITAAACVVLAVLSMVMWQRSYKILDHLSSFAVNYNEIWSMDGRFCFIFSTDPGNGQPWHFASIELMAGHGPPGHIGMWVRRWGISANIPWGWMGVFFLIFPVVWMWKCNPWRRKLRRGFPMDLPDRP